jgi:3-isopropylmalate dehydrogenase
MMLEYLGHAAEATLIETAVSDAIHAGETTKDLGGSLGTKKAGEAILTRLAL